jgi:glutamate 5-kinase
MTSRSPIGWIQQARLVVLKVGTRVLSHPSGIGLSLERMDRLADEMAQLRQTGRRLILVSSGAIGAGMALLGWSRRPKDLVQCQAAAAVGQSQLMQWYAMAFQKRGIQVAQILLTREDLAQRHRYLNARKTMHTLLQAGILPIVNENDTVSAEEIRFGDNDELSALVAQLMDAQLLVILTDVDGFQMPSANGTKELIHWVERITPQMERWAQGPRQSVATGGMRTKLKAARMATASGIGTLLINGTREGILKTLFLDGHFSGTFFLPSSGKRLPGRKRWLAFTVRPKGTVLVDSGAKRALVSEGKSLLASGVRRVDGTFRRGDLVGVLDEMGKEFARGLVNYPDHELRQICGMRSDEIAGLLGRKPEEVIHRDSLVIME